MMYQKIFTFCAALLILGGCTPNKATPSNAEPDLSTSEGLVHAVFHALKNHDAQGYMMLTANTKEELQVIIDNAEFEPTDEELEELR